MSTQALSIVQQYEDEQLLATIRDTVCKGATPAQFRMFIEVCKATGLNPFLKEIWYVPSVGVMAARDGYLRIANQHPQFDGMETRVERDDKNIPIKAVCTVWRKDRGHPVIAEAYYNEYKKGGNVWNTYPSAMIGKVAEVLALKRSFAINGVVTEEEIGEQGSKEQQREYLASKGLEPWTGQHQRIDPATIAPPTKPEIIRELAATLDQPPTMKTLEMRSAAQVAEAAAALKEVKKPPAKKKGAVSFDVLKHFGIIKQEILEAAGSEEPYYAVLRSFGFEKSNEITDNDKAREVYKALGAERNRLKQENELRNTLLEIETVLGKKEFADILGLDYGIASIDEVLTLESERLQALLTYLKHEVDQKAGKS